VCVHVYPLFITLARTCTHTHTHHTHTHACREQVANAAKSCACVTFYRKFSLRDEY